VTQVLKLKLSHKKADQKKNHEAKFPIKKILINKISNDEIEKKKFK
jgi:hypothetical protein